MPPNRHMTISALHFPVCRDLAQPLDTGIPVLRVWPEALRPRLGPFGHLSHCPQLPSKPDSLRATARPKATWRRTGCHVTRNATAVKERA